MFIEAAYPGSHGESAMKQCSMVKWEAFDECGVPNRTGIDREDITPSMYKRLIYLYVICEKHLWAPVNTELSTGKDTLRVSWKQPVERYVLIHENEETVIGTARPVDMVNMESTLLWQLSREMNVQSMRMQFNKVFEEG